MQLRKRYGITSRQRVITSLVVMLTLTGSVVTSQSPQTIISKVNNKRLDVTAQNVTTYSAVECYETCQKTAGCMSVNLSPDRRTCQLLSEATSDVTSLQSANGWSYMRRRRHWLCYASWKIEPYMSVILQLNIICICRMAFTPLKNKTKRFRAV